MRAALADRRAFLGYRCVLVEDCGGMTSPDFCREATLWNVKFCFGFVTSTSQIIEALPSWAGIRARLVDLC
jgi:nicotinamidase-related amidase